MNAIVVKASSDLSAFATALKPVQKKAPVKISKRRTVTKLKLNAAKQTGTEPELNTAVIWHAPPAFTIVPAYSPFEMRNIDDKAAQIMMQALFDQYPALNKATKFSKMDFLKAVGQELVGVHFDAGSISTTLGAGKIKKEDARKLLGEIYSYLRKNYNSYKKVFQPEINRQEKVLVKALKAKENIVSICGYTAMQEIEMLWTGEGSWQG